MQVDVTFDFLPLFLIFYLLIVILCDFKMTKISGFNFQPILG